VSLGVRLSRCHAVCVRRINLGGEGNALYPVLSSCTYILSLSTPAALCSATYRYISLTIARIAQRRAGQP